MKKLKIIIIITSAGDLLSTLKGRPHFTPTPSPPPPSAWGGRMTGPILQVRRLRCGERRGSSKVPPIAAPSATTAQSLWAFLCCGWLFIHVCPSCSSLPSRTSVAMSVSLFTIPCPQQVPVTVT